MAESVGTIGLDLMANTRGFERQMGGLANKAGGIVNKAFVGLGITIGACFAVDKIVKFSKECLKLGSDLGEVQNVVDVTFGSMNAKVNEFAQGAANSYGLSETMAKKYMGTFGAMSKAFNFNTEQAYNMSAALTGLSGDIASFYNITQDEAYTKLKSVFTGETETLKDLGVVMTQNALDAYAMANGYGKTTAKMTEQEKVALRLAFVQEKLALASGDFARTQGSWANQTRLLTLQWQSFKATIGQGLINLLTPVLKVINTILAKLQVMANAFKSFTETFMGKQESSGIGSVTGDIADATVNMDGLQDSTTGVGDAAKETAKKIKKSVMGFDELNLLGDQDEPTDNGGDVSIPPVQPIPPVDTGSLDNALNQSIANFFSKFKDEIMRLKDIFKTGWDIGLNGSNFDSIKEHIKGIAESLKNIFTDEAVVNAAKRFVDTFILNLGKIVGSMASIGITATEFFLGSIDKFLEQNTDFIKEKIISLFNISGEIANIVGDFFVAFAKIFEVFRSDAAKQIGAYLFVFFNKDFCFCLVLVANFGGDLLNVMLKPIIDNAEKIKTALEGTFEVISGVLSSFKKMWDEVWENAGKVYDKYFKPMFDAIANGNSELLSHFLDVYMNKILPLFDKWGEGIGKFFDEHLKPMLMGAQDLFGKLGSVIQLVYEKVIYPFFQWLINDVLPQAIQFFEWFGRVVEIVFGIFADVATATFKVLGGIIDFVVGVFSGDWELAWQGIKDIFTGFWDAIVALVTGAWDLICTIFGGYYESIKQEWENWLNGLSERWNGFTEWIKGVWSGICTWFCESFLGLQLAWDTLCTNISLGWQNICTFFSELWNGICVWFNETIEGLKGTWNAFWAFWNEGWQALCNWFFELWTNLSSRASEIWESIKTFLFDTWNAISTNAQEIWNNIWTTITGFCQNIWNTVVNIWNAIWNALVTICQNIWNGVSGVWNSIQSTVVSVCENIKNWVSEKWESLKNAIVNAVENAKESVIGTFQNIYDNVTSTVKSLVDAVTGWWDALREKLSKPIEAVVNTIRRTILGDDQGSGQAQSGSSQVKNSTPHLATGGYIKANTPKLVTIGDNKKEGEIVSPEGKMMEVFMEALRVFTSQNANQTSKNTQPQAPAEIHLNVQLGDYDFINTIIDMINNETRRQGQSLIMTNP
ncbi:MAG: hypothetical protein RR579_06350 [Eubacterium sp.]